MNVTIELIQKYPTCPLACGGLNRRAGRGCNAIPDVIYKIFVWQLCDDLEMIDSCHSKHRQDKRCSSDIEKEDSHKQNGWAGREYKRGEQGKDMKKKKREK